MGIDGCTALVTGANRGIGAAFVRVLLEGGARKVYAGARDVTSLAGAVAEHGDRLVPVRLDVTNASDRQAAAEECPYVDLVVSNAGVTCLGPVLEVDDADARAVFEVTVFGRKSAYVSVKIEALAQALKDLGLARNERDRLKGLGRLAISPKIRALKNTKIPIRK